MEFLIVAWVLLRIRAGPSDHDFRMQDRRIAVFFYGLFMDAQMLRERGLQPQAERRARLDGFALRIGKRAGQLARRLGLPADYIARLAG